MKTNKQGVRDLNGRRPARPVLPPSPSLAIGAKASAVALDLERAHMALVRAHRELDVISGILGPGSVFAPVLGSVRVAHDAAEMAVARLNEIEVP